MIFLPFFAAIPQVPTFVTLPIVESPLLRSMGPVNPEVARLADGIRKLASDMAPTPARDQILINARKILEEVRRG